MRVCSITPQPEWVPRFWQLVVSTGQKGSSAEGKGHLVYVDVRTHEVSKAKPGMPVARKSSVETEAPPPPPPRKTPSTGSTPSLDRKAQLDAELTVAMMSDTEHIEDEEERCVEWHSFI
jgi:hypothetical protein